MVDQDELAFAVAHLRRRTAAEDAVRTALATIPERSEESHGEREAHARHMIKTVQALRAANRITLDEYVYQAAHWCMDVIVEDRMMAGAFAEELQPIEDAIDEVERRHGLAPGEYWLRDEGPEDWQELNAAYESVIERKRHDALRECGLSDIADLVAADPDRFHHIEEEGRRALRGEVTNLERLDRMFRYYLADSQAAERAGAYYAAVVMRGAALEARLLLKCLQRSADAQVARNALPAKRQPRGDMLRWSLAQLIDVAFAAGWLPKLPIDDEYVVSTRPLAELVRELRNLLHPGRHLQEGVPLKVDDALATDARAALTLVEAVFETL